MVIHTKYYKNVCNDFCNDLFNLNRDWNSKDKNNDNIKLIYRLPPLEDAWIYEQGCRNCRNELENQRRRWEDLICEKNCTVPDIIPLTEDNDARTSTGAPVFDNNAIFDSLLGHPPT